MSEFFNNDISFGVAENDMQIESVRVFGEKLLHIELVTAYGKKEIVCGRDEAIQNFVVLQGRGEAPERFGVFASYCLSADGNIKISLRHEDGVAEEWFVNLSEGAFSASGERTLCGTLMLSKAESIK